MTAGFGDDLDSGLAVAFTGGFRESRLSPGSSVKAFLLVGCLALDSSIRVRDTSRYCSDALAVTGSFLETVRDRSWILEAFVAWPGVS